MYIYISTIQKVTHTSGSQAQGGSRPRGAILLLLHLRKSFLSISCILYLFFGVILLLVHLRKSFLSFCRHFESCDFCFLIIHNLPCLIFCLCPDFVDCHEYGSKNRGKGRAILSRRKTKMLRMDIVGLGKI